MKKILIIGKNGQVAKELVNLAKAYKIKTFAFGRNEFDINSIKSINNIALKINPDLIINASAYTLVDKAELEKEEAHKLNSLSVKNLAKTSKALRIPFFHISTDYVYDGKIGSPFKEIDKTSPMNSYGASKLSGEEQVRINQPNHIILRTSWVFSSYGNNFVKTMIKLGQDKNELSVVSDQLGGPTSAKGIADCLLKIALSFFSDPNISWGTYNYCGSPFISWNGFAKKIFEDAYKLNTINKIPNVKAILSKDYPSKTIRPLNSTLDCNKLFVEFKIKQDDWQAQLKDCLKEVSKKPLS